MLINKNALFLDGIANYINTVENSAAPQLAPEQPAGNPYAGHMPGVAQPAAGLTKQPVATSISCAKCKIEKPKGKISKLKISFVLLQNTPLKLEPSPLVHFFMILMAPTKVLYYEYQ